MFLFSKNLIEFWTLGRKGEGQAVHRGILMNPPTFFGLILSFKLKCKTWIIFFD